FLGDYLGLARGKDRVYPCYFSTQNGDPDIYTHVITILGGCCLPASCAVLSRYSCESQDGTFLGTGRTCSGPDCNANNLHDLCEGGGGCCVDGSCTVMTPACCTSEDGMFLGAGTTCVGPDCNEDGVRDECQQELLYSACCLSDTPGDCIYTTSCVCEEEGGAFWDVDKLCNQVNCAVDPPDMPGGL
ncbi:MAG: hypothetical protein Q7R41_03935, partial [Phycisphaerales bacterium]|nr:hypothetical protein [Phycisphaerales bacterium]